MTQTAKRVDPQDALHTLETALATLRRTAEDAGEDALTAVHKASASAIDAAQHLLDQARERSAELAKGAVREAREHPIATTAAVAAAAAAIIGLIAAQVHRRK